MSHISSQAGVQSLNYVIATHPDADHIGGMDVVVDEIDVEKFIMPIMPQSITPTTRTYIDLLQSLERNNVGITEAAPGSDYALGNARFTLLGPLEEHNSSNDMSAIFRVDFGDNRFLFMGDAEREAENSLLKEKADIKADFIKPAITAANLITAEFLQSRPRVCRDLLRASNAYGTRTKTRCNLKTPEYRIHEAI